MCCDSKQNAAVPSPQTTAPTSAPLPGMQDSSTRDRAILSHPSTFSIITSRLDSMSSVWNAPNLTWSFADVTRPEMPRDAVGGGAVDPEAVFGVAVPSAGPATGAEAEEKSTWSTWTVKLRRIRCDSTEPVEETFCTRLIQLNHQDVTRQIHRCAYRIAVARTESPFWMRLYKCHISSSSSGLRVTKPCCYYSL